MARAVARRSPAADRASVKPGVATFASPGRRCGVARGATGRSNAPCGSRAGARVGGSGAQTAGSRAPGLAVLVLDRNGFIIETGDPGIGESDAKDITGEVVEHRLFAVAPGGDVEDPALAPHRVGDDEIGTLLA